MKRQMTSEKQKNIRAFIAVKLPLELAAMLHKKAQHRAGDVIQRKLRWVVPQQQHITLRFLGECQQSTLDLISSHLEGALKQVQAFDSMTGCYEFLPDANRPRVLALSMHSGQQLQNLAAICEDGAVRFGLQRERRNFRPHVTLARFKQYHHVSLRQFFNMPSFRMTVTEVALMQSEMTREGTRYKTLKSYPLQPVAISA